MQHGSFKYRTNIMLTFVIITFLVSTCRAGAFLKEAPSFITPCKLHDPGNGHCVTDIFQNVFSKLHGGIPGYKRVPKLDPIKVNNIQIKSNDELAVIDLNMTDIVGTGLAQATLSNGSFANGDFSMEVSIHLPKFTMKGDYKMKATISILDIDGKGPFQLDLSNVNFMVRFKSKIVQRSEEYFLKPLSLKTKIISIDGIKIRFDQLYANNDELTDATNDLFNANRDSLLHLMGPAFERTMDVYLLNFKEKLFSTVPGRFLFTDLV